MHNEEASLFLYQQVLLLVFTLTVSMTSQAPANDVLQRIVSENLRE